MDPVVLVFWCQEIGTTFKHFLACSIRATWPFHCVRIIHLKRFVITSRTLTPISWLPPNNLWMWQVFFYGFNLSIIRTSKYYLDTPSFERRGCQERTCTNRGSSQGPNPGATFTQDVSGWCRCFDHLHQWNHRPSQRSCTHTWQSQSSSSSHDSSLGLVQSGKEIPTSTLASMGFSRKWYLFQDSLLHVLPLHHVHGITNCLLTPLSIGANVTMLEKFDPEHVWQYLLQVMIKIGI